MSDENGFWNKFRTGFGSGLSSSKKIMDNARKKTREIEEYGVLKIDIKRLETRNSELFRDLGLKVYSLFSEEGKASVSAKSPLIRGVLNELDYNREMLKIKEEKLAGDNT